MRDADPGDGPSGNELLTAWAGAALFVLLAIEGLTIVRIGAFVVPHVAVGMVLVAAVLLKIGSTGYRFVRYYTGSATYRQKGPPRPLLRMLAPLVVLSTLAVLASGVALLALAPGSSAADRVLQVHKATFVLWFVVMTVHVLAYLSRVPRLLAAEVRPVATRTRTSGLTLRLTLLAATCAVGVLLAAATVHLGERWSGAARSSDSPQRSSTP